MHICLQLTAQQFVPSDTTSKMAIKTRGGKQTEFIYTEVSFFNEGIAWVNKGDLYGFIDSNLTEITPFKYTEVSHFQHSFAIVSRDSTFGFINKKGFEICPLKYQDARNFKHGIAAIQLNDFWGIIDTAGKEITAIIYDYPPFSIRSNFILATRNNKWGVVNNHGEILYPFEYDFIGKDGIAFTKNKSVLLGLR